MDAPAVLLAILIASGPPCDTPPVPHRESILDLLARGSLREDLARLFERSRYGLASFEAAAWIVTAADGTPSLRLWKFTGAFERAGWRGPTPSGAVAVVHTHPDVADPRPSSGDVDLARRLGLPVFALSRRGLWVARPDGEVRLEETVACVHLRCRP